jgi:peptidyl-prolyl cis-trans isomerase SurA
MLSLAMKLLRILASACALLLSLGGVAFGQQYTVDRVAAVVGDKPILLSTVRRRARPFITNMERTVTDPAERMIASARIYRELMRKLVAEQLIAKAARQADVTVQRAEVDRALDEVAKQNNLTRVQLFSEVHRTASMSEREYRLELERQLLEYKMLQRLKQQHPTFVRDAELRELHRKLTDQGSDLPPFEQARAQLTQLYWQQRLEQMRDAWLLELRQHTYVEVRWSP